MSKAAVGLIASALVGLVFCVCWAVECRAGNELIVDGADLFDPLIQRHLNGFAATGAACPFRIRSSTTGKGFAAFVNGKADLVMASRQMNDAERDKALAGDVAAAEKLVGAVGLALVTSAKNPVGELTLEQLRKIFVGEYTNWQQVGGPNERIRILTRAVPETGAGMLFQEKILKGAAHAAHAEVVSSYRVTMLVCSRATDGLAIGYIPTSSAYFTGLKNLGIKLVMLRKDENSPAVAPTKEALLAGEYPIKLPFYLYWRTKSSNEGCLNELAEFVASREGETGRITSR
jgi:phosphate transport system substrate-binding protein